MIIKNVNLETVCGITSAIPDNLLDEVAFAGKSNVGKSSLINALMNRKSLARTSSQPGILGIFVECNVILFSGFLFQYKQMFTETLRVKIIDIEPLQL